MDLSHLDKKYFIDAHVYNCPFCKRGNVIYKIIDSFVFDWSNSSKRYGYLVKCGSDGCGKISLHFSKKELRKTIQGTYGSTLTNEFKDKIDLDNEFFYSRPTSFFTIDDRINKKIRDLVFEAEQSRQANLLVGGSACLRKAIYELLEFEQSMVRDERTGYANYQESIKKLKNKFSNVSSELFDALSNIQEMASDNLHEDSWEAWDSGKLKFLIELTKTTLDEMYVIPDDRKNRLGILSQLKEKLIGDREEIKQQK